MELTKEKFIKDYEKLLIDTDMSDKKIAGLYGVSHAAINKKKVAASWRYVDFVNLLDKLGYDVVWEKRE